MHSAPEVEDRQDQKGRSSRVCALIGLEQIAEQAADEDAPGKADAIDAEESVLERLDQNERQFGIERGKRLASSEASV